MTEFPSPEDPQPDSPAVDDTDEFVPVVEQDSPNEPTSPTSDADTDTDAAGDDTDEFVPVVEQDSPNEPTSPTSDADTETDAARDSFEPAAVDIDVTTSPVEAVSATDAADVAIAAAGDTPFSEEQLLDAADPLNAGDDEAAGTQAGPAGPASGSQPPPPRQPPPPSMPPPPSYGAQPGYGAQPPVRRLFRSRHDRKLGGVSAGIAEFLRVDPTLVRVVTLLFALTGIGVLVYFVAWIIIPMRPEGFVDAPRPAPTGHERTMTLALGVAALALAFGIVTGSWAVLALALVGGGVWLLSEQTSSATVFAGVAPPAGYQPPATTPPAPASSVYAPAPSTPASPTPGAAGSYYPPPNQRPAPTYPPSPPKERKPQRITWTVLSLLALLAAVGIAASTGDWWNVSATRFLGVGLVIIGIGVVLGQVRRGGARGLIPLGILAAIALFPVSAVDGLIGDGVGEVRYRPTTIAELQPSYEHGVGVMTVDLSSIDFSGQDETIDIDLGIGELIVIVGEDTGGQAILQAKAGEITHMLPQSNSYLFEEGVNIDTGTITLMGESGTLDLNVNVGLGTAELRSEDS